MEISVGLPGHAPWSDGRSLVEWARRAELRGFAGFSVNDRLLWSTPEPLTMLAAAAGATSCIRLMTSVVLAPLHTNHLLFAKAIATLDHLAGPHRLQLGLAAGIRDDDYTASGIDYAARGEQFTLLLDRLHESWRADGPPGLRPATPGGPPLLFGGTSQAALRRIAMRGSGWLAGTATAEDLRAFTPKLHSAWGAEGREGAPRIVASAMFALGPDADQALARSIGPYYAFAGDEAIEHGIATALTSPERIRSAIDDFDDLGCDELILTGNNPNPDQVDQLADVIEP